MTRQQAVALVQYLSRAHGLIPTTGAEWEFVRQGIEVIENVANGRTELIVKKPEPTEVRNAAS